SYIQLDLGKRPAGPDDDVDITIDDARHLVAKECGFENWTELRAFVETRAGRVTITDKPMDVRSTQSSRDTPPQLRTHEWPRIREALKDTRDAALSLNGQMTDGMLRDLAEIDTLTSLNLSASRAITDDGFRLLARLPNLRHLDLSATEITDRSLAAL